MQCKWTVDGMDGLWAVDGMEMDCGLWAVGCGLWAVGGCGLWADVGEADVGEADVGEADVGVRLVSLLRSSEQFQGDKGGSRDWHCRN